MGASVKQFASLIQTVESLLRALDQDPVFLKVAKVAGTESRIYFAFYFINYLPVYVNTPVLLSLLLDKGG